MHCIGWFAWRRHMNAVSAEVVKRRLPPGQALALYGLTALAVLLYGLLLQMLGGRLPYVDALGTVYLYNARSGWFCDWTDEFRARSVYLRTAVRTVSTCIVDCSANRLP